MSEECLKLTTYFGERHRVDGVLLADALLALYGRRGVQASVLLRGIEGYGAAHHLHTDRLLSLSEDLPVVSIAVDRRERIMAIAEEQGGVQGLGLMTLERARVLTEAGEPSGPEAESKLTLYVGRQDRLGGRPAFVAICELLAARGLAGATVLLGVDGTLHGERRRARFLGANRGVPMMIVAVGASRAIAAVVPELRDVLPAPLMTLERVQVCKRDGVRLGQPLPGPESDELGLALWRKLTVYSSEQARHKGSPLHVSLVRALAAQGVRGATCVRGIWGFHGDHAPHGDRLLALRRRVPVVTIVVEAPDRLAAAFAIVDAHTRHTGLVTSELVPAVRAPGH
jgi:PII-like signaling protein